MNVLNLLPFTVAYVPGRLGFPRHSLTLIVKGTFNLSQSGTASPAEEQAFPTGDGYYPGDDEGKGSPRYESDFAWFKPRSDLLLVGKCRPPGGRPTRRCPVTFRVGDRSTTLMVLGERRRHGTASRSYETEPEPFTEMELRWENSFGGAGYGKNPVGKGFCPPDKGPGPEGLPLPNIENAPGPSDAAGGRRGPAGFGPLGRTWEDRASRLGTYGADYRDTRWPWFPEDFDWGYANAAPADMQTGSFLRGDEELSCENLHPVHSRYTCRLPGLRVRAFVNKKAAAEDVETDFREVPLNLDTLWVEMEAEKLVLLWRGATDVASEDAEEVRDLFIMSEPLDTAPATLEQCRRRFEEALASGEEPAEPVAEESAGAEDEPADSPAEEPAPDAAALGAQTDAILARMGIDVARLPKAARDGQKRVLEAMTLSGARALPETGSTALKAELKATLGQLGLDPDDLPPPSGKAAGEIGRLMKELGVPESSLGDLPELAQLSAIMAVMLPRAGMDPEDLSPVIEQAKKWRGFMADGLGAREDEDASGGAKSPLLTRDEFITRAAAGESFAGANLKGLDLSGLVMKGLDFTGAALGGAVLAGSDLGSAILAEADLGQADLSRANLTGANLADANLARAVLEGSCLKEADLTQANLTEARMAGAVLEAAVCEGATLARAVLDGIEAAGADFSKADASGATFRKADLREADLSHGLLHGTNFQEANLAGACVEGARGTGADFTKADLSDLRASEGCDFSEGRFYRAAAAGSTWEGANLARSDFRYCRMEGAIFTGACLEGADLSAADVKSGRFNKANLREARLCQANLFEGTFERADLTKADLRGSNLYGAEFLDAVIERTEMDGANLKMTKLSRKA